MTLSRTDSSCSASKPFQAACYAVKLIIPAQPLIQLNPPVVALSLLSSGGLLFALENSCRLLFCQLPAAGAPGPEDVFDIGSHVGEWALLQLSGRLLAAPPVQ